MQSLESPESIERLIAGEPVLRDLAEASRQRLATILSLLLTENRTTNLTAVTDPAGAVVTHLADSLAGLDAARDELAHAASACDIGSGAGFPLLPLAVLTPTWEWSAIESVAKKTRFIERAAAAAGLSNVRVYAARAEAVGHDPCLRESFHIATVRAVGPVAALLEVGLPLIRVGGVLLLWKTADALAEAAAAVPVSQRLGGEFLPHHAYRFPGDAKERVILRIRKSGPTPATYPRRAGVPFKKPLTG